MNVTKINKIYAILSLIQGKSNGLLFYTSSLTNF